MVNSTIPEYENHVRIFFKNPGLWNPSQANILFIIIFWAQASVYFKSHTGGCKMDLGLSTTGLDTKLFWLDKDKTFCWCSVAKLCPTLLDPLDCSTPGFPVFLCLPKLAQTHVHWVGGAIQPSRPLLPPLFHLPSIFPASGSFPVIWLFTSGGQRKGASASASVLSMNIQGWFPSGFTGLISLLFQYHSS